MSYYQGTLFKIQLNTTKMNDQGLLTLNVTSSQKEEQSPKPMVLTSIGDGSRLPGQEVVSNCSQGGLLYRRTLRADVFSVVLATGQIGNLGFSLSC